MADILTTCPECEYTWDARTWTRCPRCMGTMKAYEPTESEIRMACELIRRGWPRSRLARDEGRSGDLGIPEVYRSSTGLVERREYPDL